MAQKSFALLFAVSLLGSVLFAGAPTAKAACIASAPLIGTIRSLSTRGLSDTGAATYTYIALDHAATFSTSAFSETTTSIDQYNALAAGFKQNNYQVPAEYAPLVDQKRFLTYDPDPQIGAISLDTLKSVRYQVGDIIIMGPPGGGACSSYGFIGFFGADGKIQYAIAQDASYARYSYGSETLSLAGGPDTNCSSGPSSNSAKTCVVPITYSLNGRSYVVRPGETRSLSGTNFTQVSVNESTHTILPDGMMMSDFSPTALTHILTFASTKSDPKPVPPAKSCPALSRTLARGARGSDVSMLQNFLISENLLASGSATGFLGALTEHAVQVWQSSHGVVTGGSPSTTGYGVVGAKTRAALSRCNSV